MFRRKSDRLHLVLGENSKISGNVDSPGAIFVDGTIIGDVDGAKVILGEHGCVSGNIRAGAIIIGGKIEGQLSGTDRVEIKSTGRVTGDITTKTLSIAEGGIFNGISRMDVETEKTAEMTNGKIVEFLAKEQ